jgi:flagellar assembly factor FliW
MKLTTKYFDQIEVQEDKIIKFEQGIPGFPEETQFIFLPLEDTEFLIMQSVETPELAFVTSSPFTFFKDYEIKLSEQVLDALKIERESDVVALVILSVQDPLQKSTANLLAPIVFNPNHNLGKQAILEKSTYKTKHLLFEKRTEPKENSQNAHSKA